MAADEPISAEVARIRQLSTASMVKIRESLGDALSVSKAAGRGLDGLEKAASERLAQLRSSTEQAANAAAQTAKAAAAAAQRTALRELNSASQGLASGVAIAPYPSSDWSAPEISESLADIVRVGSLAADYGHAPAALPLLTSGGWWITGERANALVAEAILRLVMASPPGMVEVAVFDPSASGALGYLSLAKETVPEIGAGVMVDRASLQDYMTKLPEVIVAAADRLASAGVANMRDFPGGPAGRHAVCVILGFPRTLTVAMVEQITGLVEAGKGRGVCFLIVAESDGDGDLAVAAAKLKHELTGVNAGAYALESASFGGVPVRPSQEIPMQTRNGLLVGWLDSVIDSRNTTQSIADLVAESGQIWGRRSTDGFEALLGQTDNKAPLVLRLWEQSPPTPNALVGGATGQGKTNLLLTMIYSLAVQYGPNELELYLLDFKEGVEFSQLVPPSGGGLPHVKVAGLESDRQFGIAVLDHLVRTMDSRAALFRERGASSLREFKMSGGSLPRLLLVIDEFQVLFSPDDEIAQSSVELLEQLARKGRSYGIHLVLASQTLSGIQALQMKRDAIFGQFHNRVSVKNSPSESEAILNFGNTAAAKINYVGGAVLNTNFGLVDDNKFGTVAWAKPAEINEIRESLYDRAVAEQVMRKTQVFVSSIPAAWPDLSEEEQILRVGQPIEVDPKPIGIEVFAQDGENIAILGRNDSARMVLNSILVSATHHPLFRGCEVLLAGVTVEASIVEMLSASGLRVSEIPLGELVDVYAGFADSDGTGYRRLVVVDGLSQAPGYSYDTRQALRRNANSGILTIGLFPRGSDLKETGDFEIPFGELFGHTVICGLPKRETDSLAFGTFPTPDAQPRVAYASRDVDFGTVLVPYAIPSTGFGAEG